EPDEDISALLKGDGAPAAAAKSVKESTPESAPAPAIEQPEVKASPEVPADGQKDGKPASGGRLVVSPIAARMAAEAGLNLSSLQGSGPGGRIIKRDVEAAMAASQPGKSAAPAL